MSRLMSCLKIPWAVLCCVCFAVITALAGLVPTMQASDGSGGYALQPSIAEVSTNANRAAEVAAIEKAPAWISARSS